MVELFLHRRFKIRVSDFEHLKSFMFQRYCSCSLLSFVSFKYFFERLCLTFGSWTLDFCAKKVAQTKSTVRLMTAKEFAAAGLPPTTKEPMVQIRKEGEVGSS
jgi:hypothetical protein